LAYIREAETGSAQWLSDGGPEQPGVGRLLTAGPDRFDVAIPPLAGAPLYHGPAKEPAAGAVAGPRIERIVPDQVDAATGQRTLRLRVIPPPDTYLVDLRADARTRDIVAATVNDLAVEVNTTAIGKEQWGWGFRYAAPPSQGIDLTIRTQGGGPLPIRVVTTVPGLPEGVDAPTLPADAGWAGWPALSGQTLAVKTFAL